MLENIFLKDTWFMHDLKEYPGEVPKNEPLVSQQYFKTTLPTTINNQLVAH